MYIKYISASSLDTYVNVCEFKYFLQKHIRLPELNQQTIYTSKGLAVHETLEEWVKNDKDYVAKLKKFYASNKTWKMDNRAPDKGFPHPQLKMCDTCPWAQMSGNSKICTIANEVVDVVDGCPRNNFEDDLKLVELVVNGAKSPLKRKILAAEMPFTEDLGGFQIHGYIDLITEIDSDTIEVCDYKTGNFAKNTEKMFKDFQMRIYSIAAKRKFPQYKFVKMTLYYLRKGPVSVIFDKDDDNKTTAYLATMYEKIKNNDDPKIMPNFLCKFCVGTDRCKEIRKSYLDKKGKFILPMAVKNEEEDISEFV